jgi:hypothetical protein
LVEVVRFFVTYGLARNKNRLSKGWDNRIVHKHTQMNKIKKKRNQNVVTKKRTTSTKTKF